jgi:hypothetical protein
MPAANVGSGSPRFAGRGRRMSDHLFEIVKKDGVRRPLETAGYASPELVEGRVTLLSAMISMAL